jgi:hypothetical protein
MKNRVLIAVLILFILQTVLLVFLFRPAGTSIDTQRTPIPTLPRATLPAASSNQSQVGAGGCQAALTQSDYEGQGEKTENDSLCVEKVRCEECQLNLVQNVQPLIKSSDIW